MKRFEHDEPGGGLWSDDDDMIDAVGQRVVAEMIRIHAATEDAPISTKAFGDLIAEKVSWDNNRCAAVRRALISSGYVVPAGERQFRVGVKGRRFANGTPVQMSGERARDIALNGIRRPGFYDPAKHRGPAPGSNRKKAPHGGDDDDADHGDD